MKVLYDNQAFSYQNFGGVSRYFYELINNSNNLFEFDIPLTITKNEYTKLLGFNKEFPVKFHFKGKNRIIDYLNNCSSIKNIKTGNYDLFHPTYYNTDYLKYLKNKPFIIDVHDMIFEIMPQYFKNNISLEKKEYFIRADALIANSQNTKNDLLKIIPEINENKVKVIYRGEIFPNIKYKKPSEKQKYILFTGQRGGYKNFDNFIKAVAPLLIKYDLELFCTGQDFNKYENEFLENNNIIKRSKSRFLSENELQDIYANALLFVFPSLYEGFGFPILEAFASGCPMLLSNSSCFPEIAQDAGIYFDPNSVENMRSTIENVILDQSLQDSIIKKGFERLKFFSWEKTVKETYKLYCDVLSK